MSLSVQAQYHQPVTQAQSVYGTNPAAVGLGPQWVVMPQVVGYGTTVGIIDQPLRWASGLPGSLAVHGHGALKQVTELIALVCLPCPPPLFSVSRSLTLPPLTPSLTLFLSSGFQAFISQGLRF